MPIEVGLFFAGNLPDNLLGRIERRGSFAAIGLMTAITAGLVRAWMQEKASYRDE